MVYILETFGGIVCSTRGVCKGRANTFGFVYMTICLYIIHVKNVKTYLNLQTFLESLPSTFDDVWGICVNIMCMIF